jgi:hypothetical protein
VVCVGSWWLEIIRKTCAFRVIICGQYDFRSHRVPRGAKGDGPVVGFDGFTNNVEAGVYSSFRVERIRPVLQGPVKPNRYLSLKPDVASQMPHPSQDTIQWNSR